MHNCLIQKYFSADGYTKVYNKHCYPSKYGSYSSISAAKKACTADSGCMGVYDQSCRDGTTDNIFLCSTTNFKNSEQSCVFKKGGGNLGGKHLLSMIIDTFSI